MNRFQIIIISFILLTLMLFLACASVEKTQAPVVSTPEKVVAAKDTLQQEWDKLVSEAKKEGKVIVIGAPSARVRNDLIQSFTAKYNIDLEYIAASGPEATAQIQTQRRAGLYILDVLLGASAPGQNILKPAGALDPLEPTLILPEVMNKNNWWRGDLPWVDPDHFRLAFSIYVSDPLAINTQMVKLDEIKSWSDLLNPKWKGKIVMDDPSQGGPGLKWFGVVGTRILDMDYMRQFAKQEPVLLRDARLAVEWVAHGKYPIGLSLQSPIVTEFQKVGTPLLQISPVEGDYITSGFGTVAVVKESPHKNAATLFLNWLLSKEGQLAWARSELRQSARADIPIDYLDKIHIRQPGIKYVSGDDEELLLEQLKQADLAREIFRPLLGR